MTARLLDPELDDADCGWVEYADWDAYLQEHGDEVADGIAGPPVPPTHVRLGTGEPLAVVTANDAGKLSGVVVCEDADARTAAEAIGRLLRDHYAE